MATKLKEVDAVIVGLGWTGGILAKELTEAGLKVVALERGAIRSPEKDFAVPIVRDELRFVVRHDLMQNTARDTLTIRNMPSQAALPMRRLGSFLPGEVVGGREVSRNRLDETIGEMIHISVIERLGKHVWGRFWGRNYKPRNFVNMLDAVKNTYGMLKQVKTDVPDIKIVDWDGSPLDPKIDADRALASQLLDAATQRLCVPRT
jgi:hypothetical protein